MNTHNFIITKEDYNSRLDKYLTKCYQEQSRSHLQKWVEQGCVLVNTKIVKSNHRLKVGDEVAITIPEIKEVAIVPTQMELDIVYEDADLMVINKPLGMVVHPAPGHYDDTLVNGIMYHCKDQLSGINGELRPGIVHRIDKDTTGLIVICKNDKAHIHLAAQLKEHTVDRIYEAIIYNNIKADEGTVEGPIGRHPIYRKKMSINYKNGKDARTHYKVIERLNDGFTHVELKLDTGRTHQIRVHMLSIGHPLLGDHMYGPKNGPFKLAGQILHAKTLGFIHPTTHEYMSFTTELPKLFIYALDRLSR